MYSNITQPRPVQLSALFVIDTVFATLQFQSHNEPELVITISHDDGASIDAVEIAGNATSDRFLVSDGNAFTVIARKIDERHIIASGVFEVSKMGHDLLLVPCVTQNLVLNQVEGSAVDTGLELALAIANAATEKIEVLR